MGLDIYLYEANDRKRMEKNPFGQEATALFETTKVKSPRFPGHVFGPRYLRSSYNDAGFNRVAKSLVGMNLYDIFSVDCDSEVACSRGALLAARARAAALAGKLRAAPALRVMAVDARCLRPDLNGTPGEGDVLASYLKEVNGRSTAGDYSNALGHFFTDEPLRVRAFIPGVDILNRLAVHAVFEANDNEWYVQAAEIVVEFIDEALGMADPCIVWSG